MYIIIPIAIVSMLIAGGFLVALLWGLRTGQYEDDFGAANRMLFDDSKPDTTGTNKKQ
ncbi:cbb3-type cytochrome oxidase assembly protein CcoS [Rurimicrobium arvi]|uniref:Cbb3-type cytochrome oxidase assembly protein CcoS n=1 Tax=Rurimicrobium arvi TaxID=2049916 RepID=A0ABP8MKF8_9BACT